MYRVPVRTAQDDAVHAAGRVNRRILTATGFHNYTVPPGVTWTVVNITISLAQVATYGTRQALVTVFDEEGIDMFENETSPVPRYAQGKFVWYPGASPFEQVVNVNNAFVNAYPIPAFVLRSGSIIQASTTSGSNASYIVMDEVAT